MKPIVRHDVYHAATGDGAYLLTPRGAVRLAGEAVGPWLDRLLPSLDGSRTVAELTEGLPPDQQEFVERMLRRLRAAGVVRDAAPTRHAELTAAEAEEYAQEIAHITGFTEDDATAAFVRHRAQRTLVAGEGPLLEAVAGAAVASGLRTVRVVAFDDGGGPRPRPRDSGQRLTWERHPEPRDAEAMTALLDRADLVLHVTSRPADRALLVERCAARTGVPLAQAVVRGPEAWLIPLQRWTGTGGAPGRWAAALPRLAAPAETVTAAPGPAARLAVAARLVQSVFHVVTGAEPAPDRSELITIDLATLAGRRRPFLPHPVALPAPAPDRPRFAERIRALRRGPRLSGQAFAQRAASCADDRLGIFRFVDTDWAQSPLHVARAVVTRRPQLSAIGFGFGELQARHQAALSALARYAAGQFDARRLPGHADGGNGEHGAGAAGPDEPQGPAVLGYELADPGRVHRVPVADAFPGLRPWRPSDDPFSPVVGGQDWQEAVTAGLLAHCRLLTLVRMRETTRPYPRVPLDEAPLGREGARCRDILAELDELPETYDVTGQLGVPTYAFCRGPVTVACAAGLTAAAALTDGLRQVLLGVQARAHLQTGYAPFPVVPGLPHALRSRDAHTPAVNPPLDVAAVAARLDALGHTAVAVPLDHDPAVAELMPYLVHVVVL
ncbi:hypothetical protein [Streptomyces sp. MP131-18]|uniref:hypothetical protein n=1 Tax=Streptomyces sp. MP131-18 TaxID=1857892 RepID=UPI00097CAD1D|nr:hypothetical protein [Streptomyces sp. MP131-18]ONK12546.1 putative thiazole-containing bacteriocin maturation protein [Streptomyces sp. MP131-18]